MELDQGRRSEIGKSTARWRRHIINPAAVSIFLEVTYSSLYSSNTTSSRL